MGFGIAAIVAGSLFLPGSADAIVKIGATGGFSFSDLSDIELGDTETTYDSKTGYAVGGFAQITAGPIAIRPGLLWVNAGPLYEGLAASTEIDFDDGFDVTFFAIPIDFLYRIPLGVVSPYIVAGPEFRFNTTSSSDFEDNFKSSIMMGAVGAGIEFTLPATGISIAPELRYEFDLNGVLEDDFMIGDVPVDVGQEQDIEAWAVRVHVTL